MKKKLFALLILAVLLAPLESALAVETESLEKVSQKLEDLSKGQKQILQELAEIKRELYVVKVRATKH